MREPTVTITLTYKGGEKYTTQNIPAYETLKATSGKEVRASRRMRDVLGDIPLEILVTEVKSIAVEIVE